MYKELIHKYINSIILLYDNNPNNLNKYPSTNKLCVVMIFFNKILFYILILPDTSTLL